MNSSVSTISSSGTFLHDLADMLETTNLGLILNAYGWDRIKTDLFRLHAGALDSRAQTLARLLILSEPIEVGLVALHLPGSLISGLKDSGLAIAEAGNLRLNNLRLINHYGAWIFCNADSIAAEAYYGNDSLALGRISRGLSGRILDFCAGVGTQGLSLVQTSSEVVCVEKNPSISWLFDANRILNRAAKARLVVGDQTALTSELGTFDAVVCNPPLLPIPPDIPFPAVGDGGETGQGILIELLKRLPHLLKPTGVCRFVTTVMGDETGPDLSPFMAGANAQVRLQLVPIFKTPLRAGEQMFDALVQTVGMMGVPYKDAFITCSEFYAHEKRSYLYFVLGSGRIACSEHQSITLTGHFLLNANPWGL